MVAFFEATQRAPGRESMLAQGLATALTTTAAGIVVAVLAITTAHFARHVQHRLFDRMGTALLGLLPVISGAAPSANGTLATAVHLNGRASEPAAV
jgi:biopolymer transport protein ExbB/TolQ